MTLSIEQKEELIKTIKKKEIQLKRQNISVKSGFLWYRAIAIILNGGDYFTVINSIKAYPQQSMFVA